MICERSSSSPQFSRVAPLLVERTELSELNFHIWNANSPMTLLTLLRPHGNNESF